MSRGGTEQPAPAAVREQRKSDLSRIVGSIINRGCATTLAFAVGVSRTLFRSWGDTESAAQIGVADAACLPDAADRMPLADFVAGPGYMMAALPSAETATARAGIEQHLRVLQETTDAVMSHAVAIADNVITGSEGATLEAKCNRAIRELLAIRASAIQSQREGVIGVSLHVVAGGAR